MINHARTLLLNVQRPAIAEIGDELIPPEFRPVPVPASVTAVHQALFGSTPDQFMLNYRAAQLLRMVHATSFHQDMLALDPRITYQPYSAVWAEPGLTEPVVTQNSGANGTLNWSGRGIEPDVTGITTHEVDVAVAADGSVTVQPIRPQVAGASRPGTSQTPLPLGISGYRVYGVTPAVSTWTFLVRNRPVADLAVLADRVFRLPLDALFIGNRHQEVLSRCARVYASGWDLLERFSAVICALIYQTELARMRRDGE